MQPPTNLSPTPPAPKKRGPWLRIGLGCLSLVLLGCLGIGGIALYQNWQQEQNYQAGHSAYLKADCAAAADPLGKAARGDPGTRDSDVARKAQAELQECEALLAADKLATDNKPGDAVMGYSLMLAKYPDSPLKETALKKGQDLVAAEPPEDLASAPLCEALDGLVGQQVINQPDEALPPLLYACGGAYEADNKLPEAVTVYERFLTDYPDHSLAADVQAAFARATIADAQASGAGELPPPQAVGAGGGAEGQVMVVIQNDSPEQLSLVFSGPEVRVERLEACAECEKFTGAGPSGCPEKGPIGRYLLTPGTYDVVVKAVGGNATPFRGSWSLEGGQEYSSCFYLVTSGG